MEIKIEACPSGHSVSAVNDTGSLNANIYPPNDSHSTWRICFAACSHGFSYLQGKVSDCGSFQDAERQIEQIFQGIVSGYLTTMKGIRGHFAVHFAPSGTDSSDLAPQSTGCGDFSTAAQAHKQVVNWSTSDGIPYQPA